MEAFTYPIEVADFNSLRSRGVEATVNTGAFFTIAPSALLRDLAIRRIGTRPVQLADGTRLEMSIGHACVTIDGRSCITIVAFGDDNEPLLLGEYTLIGLALTPDPVEHLFVSLEPLPLY